ncbi:MULTISPECIES: S8 family serine peptidase [Paenibacillus]|uniref:S8 family serine peptidase n=1 Tax=Paenibacillus TaxID=44249 RepID=UPI0022B8976B|nr:S8 family serine peptidase [Paenibacillus caseinilyticus]MCZ8523870.1 S8 family serine peptidase [Paenibacillus caseinilyticus]
MDGPKQRLACAGLAAALVLSPFLSCTADAAAGAVLPEVEPATAKELEIPAAPPEIVPGKVLVKYKRTAEAPHGARMLKAAAQGSSTVTVPVQERENVSEAVERLLKDPEVEYAEPVYRFHYTDLPYRPAEPVEMRSLLGALKGSSTAAEAKASNDPYLEYQWGLSVTELTYGWSRVRENTAREPVTIAVIDSGVRADHKDLSGVLLRGYDVKNRDWNPEDENGHGTMVAGLAAAVMDNGLGIAGAAGPGPVRILPVKVGGSGRSDIESSDVAEGIYWAADNGADVINLSLGMSAEVQAVKDAVQYALGKKVVVVAATGNDSNHWVGNEAGNVLSEEEAAEGAELPRKVYRTLFPASMPGVVAVGSVTRLEGSRLTIADFSNIGKVTITAPGTSIYSTLHTAADAIGIGDGTSFSAPLASGLAALLKMQNPELTSADVERILAHTGKSVEMPESKGGSTYAASAYYGGGLLNGKNAFLKPRLRLSATRSSGSSPGQSLLEVRLWAEDDRGRAIVPEAGSDSKEPVRVVLTGRSVSGETVTRDVYLGRTLEEPMADEEVYQLELQAKLPEEWADRYVPAAPLVLTKRPGAPEAFPAAGSYTGKQSVVLKTAAAGARLVYGFAGSTALYDYTGPVTLDESRTLVAYAVKNGISSEPRSYKYTINGEGSTSDGSSNRSSSSAGRTPASGEGSVPVPVPVTIAPPKEELKERILSAKGAPVTVDVLDKGTSGWVFELAGEVWNLAKQTGTKLILQGNGFSFVFPPGAYAVKDESKVRLRVVSVPEVPGKPGHAVLASPVYDIRLEADGEELASFEKPVLVTTDFEEEKITDPKRSGAYRYQPESGVWEYTGGRSEEGQFRVELQRFGRFAIMQWNRQFADLEGHWARTAVERMAARGVADGMTDTEFAPDAEVTRAQFTALLARTLQLPESGGAELPFGDVPADAWYKAALQKALAAGLISGMSDTTFAPDARITREQMAVMLANAQAYRDRPGNGAVLAGVETVSFSDMGEVSPWASEAVRKASSAGLLEGMPDGSFRPGFYASRAQAVTVLYRLLDPDVS